MLYIILNDYYKRMIIYINNHIIFMSLSNNIDELIVKLTNNYTEIISISIIRKYDILYWGGNGLGDRWLNKKYNYCVIYSNKKPKNYSENDYDIIPNELFEQFLHINNTNIKGIKGIRGIIGIYIYSKRMNIIKHPIAKNILKIIKNKSCVICGTTNDIICDHKNDLYNDPNVLNILTQIIDDFQPLCNHCNLQKRQICKNELKFAKLYSAKNIVRYQQYNFLFPWEMKIYDKNDKNCKKDTYWYDPIEFERKIYNYLLYTIPIINAIKRNVKLMS